MTPRKVTNIVKAIAKNRKSQAPSDGSSSDTSTKISSRTRNAVKDLSKAKGRFLIDRGESSTPGTIVTVENEVLENWREDYRDYRPIYLEFTWKMRQLVEDILKSNSIEPAQVESRTKSMESFIEKARRDGKRYENPVKDMTDLTALRIIAYDKEEIEQIAELIENEFIVDFDNSVDKGYDLGMDRFGYLCIHYIVQISETRSQLTEWKSFAPLKAEIQIRTVLQHAWAAIDHRFRYKTETEIPKHLRRKLFRLSALLELADDEFLNLKRLKDKASREYAAQIAAGNLDIELNITSLEVYFQHTGSHEYWAEVSRQLGYKAYDPPPKVYNEVQDISRRRLLQILGRLHIETVAEVHTLLEEIFPEGEQSLKKLFRSATEVGLTPLAIPYVVIGVLILFASGKKLSRSRMRKVIEGSPLIGPLEQAIYGTTKSTGRKSSATKKKATGKKKVK